MEQTKIMTNARFQRGMSLIELMIALLIGLLLSAAIITIYLSNKKTFWDTEAAASLQENSRFAMKLITHDLRLAGFYGGVDYKVIENGDIDGDGSLDTAYVSPLGNGVSCERSGIETEYEYERSIWIATVTETDNNDANGDGEMDGTLDEIDLPDGLPECLRGKNIQAFANQVGSTVLFVKHVTPEPVTVATVNTKTYIAASLDLAGHLDGAASLDSNYTGPSKRYPDGKIWEYMYHAYFISKPQGKVFTQLKRMTLENGSWSAAQTVADGIEDIQFQIGVDKNNDGGVDAYVNPSNMTDILWAQAVSANVYIMAQATTSDLSFNDTRTYTYPDRVYSPADRGRQKYHRKLYETTVTLFNNQMERTRGLSSE